ncbi:MAG: hypothetical protein AAF702_16515 [Chloroflexota bacterium]
MQKPNPKVSPNQSVKNAANSQTQLHPSRGRSQLTGETNRRWRKLPSEKEGEKRNEVEGTTIPQKGTRADLDINTNELQPRMDLPRPDAPSERETDFGTHLDRQLKKIGIEVRAVSEAEIVDLNWQANSGQVIQFTRSLVRADAQSKRGQWGHLFIELPAPLQYDEQPTLQALIADLRHHYYTKWQTLLFSFTSLSAIDQRGVVIPPEQLAEIGWITHQDDYQTINSLLAIHYDALSSLKPRPNTYDTAPDAIEDPTVFLSATIELMQLPADEVWHMDRRASQLYALKQEYIAFANAMLLSPQTHLKWSTDLEPLYDALRDVLGFLNSECEYRLAAKLKQVQSHLLTLELNYTISLCKDFFAVSHMSAKNHLVSSQQLYARRLYHAGDQRLCAQALCHLLNAMQSYRPESWHCNYPKILRQLTNAATTHGLTEEQSEQLVVSIVDLANQWSSNAKQTWHDWLGGRIRWQRLAKERINRAMTAEYVLLSDPSIELLINENLLDDINNRIRQDEPFQAVNQARARSIGRQVRSKSRLFSMSIASIAILLLLMTLFLIRGTVHYEGSLSYLSTDWLTKALNPYLHSFNHGASAAERRESALRLAELGQAIGEYSVPVIYPVAEPVLTEIQYGDFGDISGIQTSATITQLQHFGYDPILYKKLAAESTTVPSQLSSTNPKQGLLPTNPLFLFVGKLESAYISEKTSTIHLSAALPWLPDEKRIAIQRTFEPGDKLTELAAGSWIWMVGEEPRLATAVIACRVSILANQEVEMGKSHHCDQQKQLLSGLKPLRLKEPLLIRLIEPSSSDGTALKQLHQEDAFQDRWIFSDGSPYGLSLATQSNVHTGSLFVRGVWEPESGMLTSIIKFVKKNGIYRL